MKVKRFFAPDMSSAMRLVRDEVGPDAVILSNSSVAGGVEVVVALDYSEVPRTRTGPSLASRERSSSALVGRKKPQRLQSELGRTRTVLASSQESRSLNDPPFLKTQKDKQLGLDDEVWDNVLASLNRKQSDRPQSAAPRAVARNPATKPRPSVAQLAASKSVRPVAAKPMVTGGAAAEDSSLQQMRNEIDELKSMLKAQLAKSAESAPRVVNSAGPAGLVGVRDKIFKRLRRIGLSERIAERLVQAIEPDTDTDRAWKIALSRLSDALPTVGENIADRGGILAFVGATGVGKTTTIGKLAAQYVLRHGSSGIALVTTDAYRIAAHEQLRTFGRILDIPVRTVDENRSLDEALHSLRDKRLVLVDTSGMSMSSGPREAQLEMLGSSAYRIKKFLVLPCTAQQAVLQSSCEYFKNLGLNGVVLSKVDESISLGEAISAVVEQRLPVAYVGDGQKIPDNIELARANAIVSRAVVLAEEQARAKRSIRYADVDQGSSIEIADSVSSG